MSSESDDDNYDPYDENQYKSKCKKGYLYNPRTRWCCRECWIEQREEIKKEKMNNKFDFIEDIFNESFNNNNYNYKLSSEELEWYKILQLIPPKTQEEIKKQYKKLALKFHPDKNIKGEEKFKSISSAYSSLIAVY